MLFDARGRAIYLFTREPGTKSRCYGECAVAWPPVYTRGKPRALRGVDADLLGTTKRRGGRRQVTYNGHPLYYYVTDTKPGQITCQDITEFGGTWLVVDPQGNAITLTALLAKSGLFPGIAPGPSGMFAPPRGAWGRPAIKSMGKGDE